MSTPPRAGCRNCAPRWVRALLGTLVLAAPGAGSASVRLLQGGLDLGDVAGWPGAAGAGTAGLGAGDLHGPLLALASRADGSGTDGSSGSSTPPAGAPSAAPGSLDFDLLGEPSKAHDIDEDALRRRRTMLTWHQGVGLGMFGLQLATTVVGQLNYSDKFGGDNTGKYVQPHAVLAYSTLAAFVAAGTLALLAPSPIPHDDGFDRVTLHKIAMFTAAAGMAAQGVIGIWTRTREGYLDQQSVATAHLVIGYVTLAAVATGIGALVF